MSGRLVQDDERSVADEGAGQGEALALPDRQTEAPLPHRGAPSQGEGGDDLVEPGGAGGLGQRGEIPGLSGIDPGGVLGTEDVGQHRSGDDDRALGDPRDLRPPRGGVDVSQIRRGAAGAYAHTAAIDVQE